LGEPLRAPSVRSRRAIRSITFTAFISFMRFGGSATMRFAEGRAFPLANAFAKKNALLFRKITARCYILERKQPSIGNKIWYYDE
jgi:hypothetical protein